MEDLINQVFLDSENARKQISDNQLCEPRLLLIIRTIVLLFTRATVDC